MDENLEATSSELISESETLEGDPAETEVAAAEATTEAVEGGIVDTVTDVVTEIILPDWLNDALDVIQSIMETNEAEENNYQLITPAEDMLQPFAGDLYSAPTEVDGEYKFISDADALYEQYASYAVANNTTISEKQYLQLIDMRLAQLSSTVKGIGIVITILGVILILSGFARKVGM